MIKPLSNAIADGDHIYGIIKSSSINHSGKTHQFGMPNPQQQAKLMQYTLEKENIDPCTIDYIECAASGSLLFDSAEYAALSQVYTPSINNEHRYRIGSVKPNIGHLESAAALSQLTKVLLQMKYKQFAPTIDTEPQSPLINLENSPFILQKELENWREPKSALPRRAAINAFGGAGSYGHLIIESYDSKSSFEEDKEYIVIVLSAASKEQLSVYASKLNSYLEAMDDKLPALKNIAYTLQIGRLEMSHRVAIIVKSVDELRDKLSAFIEGESKPGLYVGNALSSDQYNEINNFSKLEYIAENWVKGAYCNWNNFYIDRLPQRVSLPTYSFANERYWFGVQANQNKCLASNTYKVSIKGLLQAKP